MPYIIYFIIWTACAFIGRSMAIKRNRSAGAGFAMGLLLSVVGLAVIALMGDKE